MSTVTANAHLSNPIVSAKRYRGRSDCDDHDVLTIGDPDNNTAVTLFLPVEGLEGLMEDLQKEIANPQDLALQMAGEPREEPLGAFLQMQIDRARQITICLLKNAKHCVMSAQDIANCNEFLLWADRVAPEKSE